MTIDISANNPRISYSVAAGVTQTSFTVPFEFFDDSDLNVYIDTTLQTITTNYTVAGGAGSTGTITMSVTGPKTVILTRDTTIERTTDFTAGVDINRAALNTQLDTLTAISADNKDFAERSIRITDYDPAAANLLLPDAVTRADKLLSFDTEGDVQVQAAADLLTGSVLGANYTKASYTGDGTQTAYSTVESAGSKNNIQVYVDGVYQNKATFSISGATLTFTEAPPLNSAIEFIVGNAVTSITGDASAIIYNQGGTGAQDRTLTNRLQDTVSVKDFGAIGDGAANDRPAIAAAIASGAKEIYFPSGTYYKAGTGAGQGITVPTGVKLTGEKGATIKPEGYPVFRLSENCEVESLKFDSSEGEINAVKKVSIVLEIYADDITVTNCSFEGGNQVIYIYTANRLTVDGCYFTGCGYQVLQKTGFTSNNGRVLDCVSVDCTTDFVELNSTATNPCTNWLISGNTVKNIGTSSGTLKTESRFVGATATKNIVITNNLVEGVAGDSMLHFESASGDIIVSNNTFVDPHGSNGKLWFFTNSSNVQSFHFESNIVRFTSGYSLYATEGEKVTYMQGNDDSRPMITNNSFINESSETLRLFTVSDTEDVLIMSNRIVGFDTVLSSSIGASGSAPYNRRLVNFQQNIVEDIATAVCIIGNGGTSQRHYGYYIDNNAFDNCDEVFTVAADNAVPLSLTNNRCRNGTNINEGLVIGNLVATQAVYGNAVESDATTTLSNAASYTTGTKTIFTGQPYRSYYIKVKTSDGSLSSNNSSAEVVRIDYNSPIDIDLTSISTSNSGTGGSSANFTLSMSGNNLQFTAGAARTVQVSIVGSVLPQNTTLT